MSTYYTAMHLPVLHIPSAKLHIYKLHVAAYVMFTAIDEISIILKGKLLLRIKSQLKAIIPIYSYNDTMLSNSPSSSLSQA